MEHLTDSELIDFVSMNKLDKKSLNNAAAVTGHITECEICLRKVKALQVIYDEFVRLGLHADSKRELYKAIEELKTTETPKDFGFERNR